MLIIKRADDSHYSGGTWECVGGKVEFREGIEEALKREVKEEVGLEVTVEKLLYSTSFMTDPKRQVFLLVYLCRCENETIHLSAEHSEYRWCGKQELKQLLTKNILDDFQKNNIFSIEELNG